MKKLYGILALVATVGILSVCLYGNIYLSQVHSNNISSQNFPETIAGFKKVNNFSATATGNPRVLLIGSEACPFCAAESWGVYESLQTYGTWQNLTFIHSNSTDIYSNTPGLSFLHSAFISSDVQFSGFEVSNRNWTPLQSLNSSTSLLFGRYDPSGDIPFILIGGMYLHLGSQIPPILLKNYSPNQVMNLISNGSNSSLTNSIRTGANNLTDIISLFVGNSTDNSSSSVHGNLDSSHINPVVTNSFSIVTQADTISYARDFVLFI